MAPVRVSRGAAIDAPADAVWRALAAFDGISAWADGVDHSTWLTEATEGVGCARRVQVGRTVLVERVTAWEPHRRLAYALEGLPVVGETVNCWTLHPQGSRTTVGLSTTVEPGPALAGRLVAPLLARRLARASAGLLADLTRHLAAAPT